MSVHSDDFTEIVQNLFGAYIRGEGVMIDDVDASIQNGKYIYIVDEVKAVDLSDLDVAKTRCKVMFDLGEEAFDNDLFCVGLTGEWVDSVVEDEPLGTSIKIETKLGEIEGVSTSDSVHQFLNIPYAEPPVDELRWRPPKSLVTTSWKGTYDGTKWGNACSQPAGMPIESELSEDCLYLNVFTPHDFDENEGGSERLPVMFWIHGGGLIMGSGVQFNGSSLAAEENIVVVPINYRLGIAAFLADPELKGSPTGSGAANGFLDMIEALKWVQHNIESFGGDPDQVTIAGESGGGIAVCGLVVSPLAKGLFERSIQMSGSCIESWGQFKSMDQADDAVDDLLRSLNVSSVDEMRSMDMQTIVDGSASLPAVDNYVFPEHPLKVMENGQINGESVMIGTMFRDSFTAEPYNIGWVPDDGEDLVQLWKSWYDDPEVEMIERAYPVDEEGIDEKVWSNPSIFDDGRSAQLVSTQLQTDCWVRCGSIRQTELITENPMTESIPVYFYQMGFIEEPWDQVTHAADVNYLFDSEIFMSVYSEDFTKIVQNFFGAYIRGEGVVIDDVDASIQNGQYIYIVDEVKAMDLSELDMVTTRCEVMFDLGDDAFTNGPFCIGEEVQDAESDDDDSDDSIKVDEPQKSSPGFDEVKDAVCSWLCSD